MEKAVLYINGKDSSSSLGSYMELGSGEEGKSIYPTNSNLLNHLDGMIGDSGGGGLYKLKNLF